MGDNRIGIEFGQTGAESIVAATQQTSAAVKQANETAATTAKASGDDQVRTHAAVGNSAKGLESQMDMLGKSMMGALGAAALLKAGWDAVKDTLAEDVAARRLEGTLERLHLNVPGVTEDFERLTHQLELYGVKQEKLFGLSQRLVNATKDTAQAALLLEVAVKASQQIGVGVDEIIGTMLKAVQGIGTGMQKNLAAMGLWNDNIKTSGDVIGVFAAEAMKADFSLGEVNIQLATVKQQIDDLKESFTRLGMPGINAFLTMWNEKLTDISRVLDTQIPLVDRWQLAWNVINPARGGLTFWHKLFGSNTAEEAAAGITTVGTAADVTMAKMQYRLSQYAEQWNKALKDAEAGGAADGKDTGAKAEFDKSAWADMVANETAFGQLAADNQLEIAVRKETQLTLIEDRGTTQRVALQNRAGIAYRKMIDDALNSHKAFQAAAGQFMSSSIQGMTNLWSDYFQNLGNKEIVQRNMWAESGKLMLAMLLQQVQQALQTEAVKQATLAGAFFAGSIANPLLLPIALGHAAAAAALGLGAVAAGVGSSMLTPKGAETVTPVEVTNPNGGGSGGNWGDSYGSEPRGGGTITNSTVNIYYNPTMVVSGNVYGMDDFRQLIEGFFRQYSYIRGIDLATQGG